MARKRFQRGQLIDDGSVWRGRWREDVEDANGVVRRVQRKEVLGTKEEIPTKRLALRELERRLAPINSIEYRPLRRILFSVFAKRWREKVLALQKRSSQSSARSIINVHLLPAFGEMSMSDITMETIQQFVTGSTKSPKTVRNCVVTLMSMWSTAQAWGYAQHNPFQRGASGRLLLKLPAAAPSETYHFTVEEAMAIIAKAEGKWRTFFRILAETGMRPGELAGLRRDAIGDNSLTITQSVWGQQVQTPKSKAGVRTFAVASSLTEELRQLVKDSPENAFGLVFVTDPSKGCKPRYPGGRPLSMDNFRKRVLSPILKALKIDEKLRRLGITRCGNYAFRHMNATLMDTLHAPMKTRQKRLGHAQIETTLKHYTHAVDADDRFVADQIGALLATNKGTEAVQ